MRMNSKISAVALAIAAITASGAAQAQSTDVSVIGTIIPGSCVPEVNGGAVIDFGKISAATLSQTDYNPMPLKTVSISVQCDSPIKFALGATDNRAASRIPGIVQAIEGGLDDNFNFGLGAVSGANVGGYYVRALSNGSADGTLVAPIRSDDSGQSWVRTTGAFRHNSGSLMSFSNVASGNVPIDIQNYAGDFEVGVVLNKGQDLPLQNDVPIDGNATIEVTYL